MEAQKHNTINPPEYNRVFSRDEETQDGYTILNLDEVDSPSDNSSLEDILQGARDTPIYLNTRTNVLPQDNSIAYGYKGNGYRTFVCHPNKKTPESDADNEEYFFVPEAKKPVAILQTNDDVTSVHLSGFEINSKDEDNNDYMEWVDEYGRVAVVNLTLSFANKEQAIAFLRWIKQDFEERLKEVIRHRAPTLTEWSNAWRIKEGYSFEDARIIQQEVPQNSPARNRYVFRNLVSSLFNNSQNYSSTAALFILWVSIYMV